MAVRSRALGETVEKIQLYSNTIQLVNKLFNCSCTIASVQLALDIDLELYFNVVMLRVYLQQAISY